MTAVIGILLLIVMLMCLHLTNAMASAPPAVETDSAAEALEQDLQNVTIEEQQLDERIARAKKKLDESRDSRVDIEHVAAQRQKLSDLYKQTKQADEELRAGFESLKETVSDDETRAKLEKVAELEQEKERLVAELRAVRANRGLTYFLNQNAAKSPLLVVASANAIRVGVVGSEQGVITLAHMDRTLRMEAVREWLRSYSAEQHYVLLVLKPSGVELRDAMWELIDDLGFAQGLDLLPEDWTVLQYNELASENK